MRVMIFLLALATMALSNVTTACNISPEQSLTNEVEKVRQKQNELAAEIKNVIDLIKEQNLNLETLSEEQRAYGIELKDRLKNLLAETTRLRVFLEGIRDEIKP